MASIGGIGVRDRLNYLCTTDWHCGSVKENSLALLRTFARAEELEKTSRYDLWTKECKFII